MNKYKKLSRLMDKITDLDLMELFVLTSDPSIIIQDKTTGKDIKQEMHGHVYIELLYRFEK